MKPPAVTSFVALACLVSACGGKTYPDIVGTWSGTAIVEIVGGNPPVAHLCDATWIATSESDGAIAGTYTINGGNGFDVTCTGSSSGGSGS